MSIKINVDPSRLETSASHIDQQVITYEKNYHRLFQEVDAMATSWQGKDNLAFAQQIKGFQSDFNKMSALMRDYANFLKQSARIYRETQDDRVNQARRLAL